MINVDNKIKNIYYMLCYSFNSKKLSEIDEANLGSEAFSNIYNLFSILLYLILNKQIKKGIIKNYNRKEEELSTLRGRININQTINNGFLSKKKLVCDFDDYNENCLINKVIKTTLFYLIKSNKIGKQTKKALKNLNLYFENVDVIEIKTIKWDQLRFNRNNKSYKVVIDLCNMILNDLVVSDKKGQKKYKEFLDDSKLSAIYENFVREYFRKHYKELNASSRILRFNDSFDSNIPVMKTDITLQYKNRTLIIDTKFYNKILKNREYSYSKNISNGNLYQILAYVDNLDPYKKGNVEGMILYAQTIEETEMSITTLLNKHKISINTIDLNKEWINISDKLNKIANKFINNE